MTDFLIASHGVSASAWLAAFLHTHPKVHCVHGSQMQPVSGAETYDIDAIRAEKGMAGLLALAQQVRRGAQQRGARPLSQVFGDLRAASDRPIRGAVHSFRLRDLPGLDPGDRAAPIVVFNLVRHPVDVVHSAHGLLRQSMRIDLHEAWWTAGRLVSGHLQTIETLAARHDLFPGDPEVISFFGACLALEGLAADQRAVPEVRGKDWVDWAGTLRSEDVTGDSQTRADLLTRIGADPVAARALPDRINAHAGGGRDQGPRAKWARWSDWQRSAFQTFFDTAQLRAAYTGMGYDLSMIPEGAAAA
ncbi:hypothetical protein [Aestuariicoccus sp. MJ-SS9]|uniref:hypothetical protein n=1 Tax=Aestuariicoccus sp. MJ-SS9 TaxID=3079855 RepID=UPI00290FFDA8|nr:hypothetical protein [Aestuariicoccus sp. MJ-SS9]MDU8909786.1 hypothetical protein [Aestuariicoccus sp. MJ-SS9]